MEIDRTNNLMSLGKTFQTAETQVAEKDRRTGTDAAEFDRVDLSNHVKDISRLNDLINAVPDVRESQVNEVRFAIEGGTYDVRAEQVAEKIMGGNLLDETI
jgi:flagellar biosynthesis anti-sigma factor FlgM